VTSDVGSVPRDEQHDFWQLRAGPFRMDTVGAALPTVAISSEWVKTLVRSHGLTPGGYLGVGVALSATRPTRWSGRTVAEGQAVVAGSACELDCIVDGGGFHMVAVGRTGARSLFLNEPDAPALVERWMSSRGGILRADPTAVRRLATFVGALLRSHGCATPELAAHAADGALSLLARLLRSATAEPPPRGPGRPSGRRRMALAAENVVLTETRRPHSVRSLCAAIGASERALEIAFHDHFGVSPARYLRVVRLHRVHSDLLASGPGATVTEAAYRHGFWHLPRFAAHYRTMFRELPSITLARARA
jgi:AraC-like DNA-binding protein